MKAADSASSLQRVPKNPDTSDSYDNDLGLPPVICSNTREKITGENILVTELGHSEEKKLKRDVSVRLSTTPIAPLQPNPRYPLTVAWAPSALCFNLYEEKVIKHLIVQNSCEHSIYIQCCGLWDSNAKQGASWKSYPRTRFLLAPGLTAVFAVMATPREYPSPIPSANVALQLVAAHMRDNVAGYFMSYVFLNFSTTMRALVMLWDSWDARWSLNVFVAFNFMAGDRVCLKVWGIHS